MATTPLLSQIPPLSQDARLEARESARNSIIKAWGESPDRDQFAHHTTSQYPIFVTRIIIALCLIALFAAFCPSAIRLYHIGSETFGIAIDHTTSKHLVGITTVVMAEVSQLVFSLSLAVLGTSHTSRRLLYGSMAIATTIALVGNIQVALVNHWDNPFAWLEAIAPPLLVLSLAYILKEQMLQAVQQRYANERAYQQALAEWKQATANPEKQAQWQQFYANALRDKLTKANRRRQQVNIYDLTLHDWQLLVQREIHADQWFASEVMARESSSQEREVTPLTHIPLPVVPTKAHPNGSKPD